ncbi:fluoride efflux transporter CrcB [Paenibacillus sp. FSL R10-2782]|uniref:fluoride efflux transporter CrcB n=1 Tax=Paenibacillus sp. FSL R10-2782 TaxID=2954661 RepID=UPI0031596E30
MIWWAAAGGMVGTLARYGLGMWAGKRFGIAFPWGTWIINISGSFLLGWLYGEFTQHNLSLALWMLLGTGFCGGYTTFSTFGYESLQLMERKEYRCMAVYVLSSVVVGAAATAVGFGVS